MKTLKELLKESLNEAQSASFDSNAESARAAVMDGADVLIEYLNSPSKLNKYFAADDKSIKKDIYNLLAELASDLYTWMSAEDIYSDIDEDSAMMIAWENRQENASDDYDDEVIERAFEIWPKLWKDVVKFDWIW